MSPRSVRTPAPRRARAGCPSPSRSRRWSRRRCARPCASASVVSIGFVRPSPGIHTAPARSSVRISGHRRPASAGEITSISTPKQRAIEAPRLSSYQALRRARHADAARAAKARGLARLRLETLVEHGAVAGQAREVVAGAQLADEPRRVPGGAAGQLAPLEQDDVAPAELGQVIGDAAADDAAADDDDARVGGKRGRHRRTIARPGVGARA